MAICSLENWQVYAFPVIAIWFFAHLFHFSWVRACVPAYVCGRHLSMPFRMALKSVTCIIHISSELKYLYAPPLKVNHKICTAFFLYLFAFIARNRTFCQQILEIPKWPTHTHTRRALDPHIVSDLILICWFVSNCCIKEKRTFPFDSVGWPWQTGKCENCMATTKKPKFKHRNDWKGEWN